MSGFMKKPTWRSNRYLNLVKKQDCKLTFAPADDAHHLIGIGNMSGMGMTAPDWATMALTRGSHTRIHNDSTLWHTQWSMILMTMGDNFRGGHLVFNANTDMVAEQEKLVRALGEAFDSGLIIVR